MDRSTFCASMFFLYHLYYIAFSYKVKKSVLPSVHLNFILQLILQITLTCCDLITLVFDNNSNLIITISIIFFLTSLSPDLFNVV